MNEVLLVVVILLVKIRFFFGYIGMFGFIKYFFKENKNYRFIFIDSNFYKKDLCRCIRIIIYLKYRDIF